MSGRFNASILFGHQTLLSNVMGRVQASGGAVLALTEAEFRGMSDLAGALNYWAAQAAPTFPVDRQPEIPYGDYSRKLYAASNSAIVVFPFTMPASGLVHLAASEFQGQPWARLLTVSMVSGDLDSPVRSQGKVPDVYITAGVEFPPGTLLYANTILTEDPLPGSTGSGFSIVWPAI